MLIIIFVVYFTQFQDFDPFKKRVKLMHHLIDRLNHFLALANMLLAMIFPFLLEIIGGSLKVCKVASGLFCMRPHFFIVVDFH